METKNKSCSGKNSRLALAGSGKYLRPQSTSFHLSLFHFRLVLSVFICVHLWFQIPATAAQTLTGIDVLEAQGFAPLAGKRVGLITNQTGIDRNRRSTI